MHRVFYFQDVFLAIVVIIAMVACALKGEWTMEIPLGSCALFLAVYLYARRGDLRH